MCVETTVRPALSRILSHDPSSVALGAVILFNDVVEVLDLLCFNLCVVHLVVAFDCCAVGTTDAAGGDCAPHGCTTASTPSAAVAIGRRIVPYTSLACGIRCCACGASQAAA